MAPMNTDCMRDIFTLCQDRPNAFAKGISELVHIYKSRPHEDFFEEFIKFLRIIVSDSDKAVCAERLIDFVAQFISSSELEETSCDTAAPRNKLLTDILTTALNWSECSSKVIRQRACELVGRIQYHLKDGDVLDDDLFKTMEAKMLCRLSDTIAAVRVQAVGALYRLQEPRNSQCEVVGQLMFHLNNDPNPEVRIAVLKALVPSNRTLEAILLRTRDVKEAVRKLAYEILLDKIPVKCLTIKQRMMVLGDGLRDTSVTIQKVVSEKLLQKWLTQCEGNPLTLLCKLDCHSSDETVEKVLKILFEALDMKEVTRTFRTQCLTELKVIPCEKLTCENAMYWRQLGLFLKSKQGDDADVQLESVLPELVVYSKYVQEFVLSLNEASDTLKKLEHSIISQQLIGLAVVVDLSDNVGRASLEHCMQKLLLSAKVGSLLVPHLITTMRLIYPEEETMLKEVISIIEEIQAPLTPSVLAANQEQSLTQPWDTQIARIKVGLNILREELVDAINAEDFAKAVSVTEKVKEAEISLQETRRQMLGESPVSDVFCTPDSDPNVVLKCLTIIAEMLENTTFTSLPPVLQSSVYEIILPRISKEDVAVRKQATRALALCCILSKQLAVEHMRLLLEIALVDRPPIQVVALKGVFDMVLSFGSEAFRAIFKSINSGQNEDEEDDDSNDSVGLDPLVSFFVKFLDADDGEVKTAAVTGLSMLQLYRHICSPGLLSRLILLWYNPNADPNSLFPQILGEFMAAYSSSGQNAVRCFEDAFLITLKALFIAPPSSPLSQIDPLDVVRFLVDVTNPRQDNAGTEATNPVGQTPHDRLAEELCNEVLKNPFASDIHVLLKALLMLQVTENASFRELQVAAKQMERNVQDKRSTALVKKFASMVRLMPQSEDKDEEGVATSMSSMTIDSATTTTLPRSSVRSSSKSVSSMKQQETLSSQDLFPSSPES